MAELKEHIFLKLGQNEIMQKRRLCSHEGIQEIPFLFLSITSKASFVIENDILKMREIISAVLLLSKVTQNYLASGKL